MKIILCLDETGGMTFLGKRQSRDARVIEDIIETVGSARLIVNSYSLPLFPETVAISSDTTLDTAGDEDFCFVETDDPLPYLDKADTLIVYNWNRHYPSDKRPALSPENHGFALRETTEFAGKSHEKITKETYVK